MKRRLKKLKDGMARFIELWRRLPGRSENRFHVSIL